ncbi:MAG: lipoprotein-releasing ABC transporter permease subunit, partial [Desulfobacterota bacterium]|nr:lipoprotein-releasing ABC transporter permease subunit [Thermodesulfobacteriota bacterium]
MSGFENDLKEKILGTNAHIRVFKLTGGMENYLTISSQVEKIKGVKATTPFIYSEAMLSSTTNVTGIVLIGINPDTVGKVTTLKQNLIQGELQNLSPHPKITGLKAGAEILPGIFIGKELAKIFGLFYLDEVTVISPFGEATPMGTVPRMKKFRIVGIFDSGMYEYDTKWAYISLPVAQQFFQMGDTVTGIEVKVDNPYNAHTIAREIEKKLGFTYQTRDWMEMNKNLFSALRIEKIIMFIILVLIILVAAFGIISILIMVVMEKTSDIAIMKTMGAKSRSIMKIFMIEGLVVGVFGTFLGTIAGLTLGKNIQTVAGWLEKVFNISIFPPDIYYIDKIPFQISLTEVGLIIFITLVISFLATVFPSWQASRLDPAEALRYG